MSKSDALSGGRSKPDATSGTDFAGEHDEGVMRPRWRLIDIAKGGRNRGPALMLSLLGVTAYFWIVAPTFRQRLNFENILQQNAIFGIVALGMLLMIISGGFDLSVGATGAAASVAAVWVSGDWGLWAGIVAALAVGLAVGIVNGVLVGYLRINPFVTTLGMASVVSGILFVLTEAQPVYGNVEPLLNLGLGESFGVPNAAWLFLVLATATWLLLRRTRFGHWVYAVGGNEQASYLSGVPVRRVKVAVYAYGSLMAAIASLVLVGQTNIGQPGSAQNWALTSIAICVVGGAALSGGRGTVRNTVVATLLLGTVNNGLNQTGVSVFWQPVVQGAVIILAVAADGLSEIRSRSRA